MVTYKGTSRFFSRNSAGKYQLDVAEIRSAVLATDSQAQRIKEFRQERIAKIIVDETPLMLSSPQRLILHVVPLASFLNQQRLDLSDGDTLRTHFRPIEGTGGRHRYNLDGLLTWRPPGYGQTHSDSYCQLFADGTIEAAYSNCIRDEQGERTGGKPGIIAPAICEKPVIKALQGYLILQRYEGLHWHLRRSFR